MCYFGKPVCLTFIKVKFMGKKAFLSEGPSFFLVSFTVAFSGGESLQGEKMVTSALTGGFNTNSSLFISLR